MFVVQEGERNAFDQRLLEYSLLEKYALTAPPPSHLPFTNTTYCRHGIKTYRVTLSEIAELTAIDPGTRALLFRPRHRGVRAGPIEVSTVYFRAGYGPGDYTLPVHWAARKRIERSRAIKCPTILTQLAGSKKIQQVLCEPETVKRFLFPKDVASIEGTFAGIYPLDGHTEEGRSARRMALGAPERFVLKPQREGGGNNVYGEKIPAFLKEVGEETWGGYVLMELIKAPKGLSNAMVREGKMVSGEVIGELGVYGVALWEVIHGNNGLRTITMKENKEVGWLLRTKAKESEEGGVAAGFGCVDAVLLVD